jgi:hypothetical protein
MHGEGVPFEALVARIDAADEVPEVRSAALLGIRPYELLAARWKVLKVGIDPRHPSFTAAVSLLADEGEEFALEMWKDLDVAPAGETARRFLEEQRRRLLERVAERHKFALDSREVSRMLALVVHVRRTGDPLHARLRTWTVDRLTAARGERQYPELLVKTADGFDPAHLSPLYAHDTALKHEVRALAHEILARPRTPGGR